MRITFLLAGALAFVLAFAPHQRAGAGTAEDIQAVIEDQIDAFGREDLPEAFSYASPGIQGLFGTPERFGQMVRKGYPMVWRPARWEMLELESSARGPVQVVLFEDGSGRLWEAFYYMTRVDGRWRIGGVELRRLETLGS